MTQTPRQQPIALMDSETVAQWLELSPAYLKKMRHEQTGPPYLKIGRSVRYHPAQVSRWLKARQYGLPETKTIGRTR